MSTAQAIMFTGMLFAATTLMVIAWWRKAQPLAMGATAWWILIAGLGFMTSTVVWDLNYVIGWFSAALAIMSVLMTLLVKASDDKKETGFKESNLPSHREQMDDFRKRSGMREPRRRSGTSNFSRTGKL